MSSCNCNCNCDNEITLVRGDTFEYHFTIDIDRETINTVCFKSAGAHLLVYLVYDESDDTWCLRLLSAETQNIKPVIASYDLVIEFINGEILTVIHNGLFAVYKRRNNVVEDST